MKKIRNNSRLYYIFACSFIILALLTVILGIFIISQLQEVVKINEEITEALLISQLALDFNVENFHTQLEVWEYAYEPNNERLIAFQEHEEKLIELSESLLDVVEKDRLLKQGAGLVPGGAKKIEKIISDLQLVRDDWSSSLFPAIRKLQTAKEAGLGEDDEEFRRLEIETRVVVIANEELFDALDFNNEIDEFVKAQEDFLNDISAEPEAIISRFIILLTVLVTLLFVLGVAVPLFLLLTNRLIEKRKR